MDQWGLDWVTIATCLSIQDLKNKDFLDKISPMSDSEPKIQNPSEISTHLIQSWNHPKLVRFDSNVTGVCLRCCISGYGFTRVALMLLDRDVALRI